MKLGKKVLITLIVIVVIIIIVVFVRKSINKKVVNEVAKTDEQLVQESVESYSNSYRTAGGNRYLSFIINLKYENQENQLQLRVYFANMTSTNPEIIYASAE